MSKSKKKRNKPYQGPEAAHGPVVHRYTAEVKSPLQEWWLERQRSIKMIAGIGGGAILVGWLLFEFFRLIF